MYQLLAGCREALTHFGEPFSGPDWLFDINHDGFRLLAYV